MKILVNATTRRVNIIRGEEKKEKKSDETFEACQRYAQTIGGE